MKKGGTRDGFNDRLVRRYGDKQGNAIMDILTLNRAGESITRRGKRTYQTRGRYPAKAEDYPLRQIMAISRKAAAMLNRSHADSAEDIDIEDIVGASCATKEEADKLYDIVVHSIKKHKQGASKGRWYASLHAAKKASDQDTLYPVRVRGKNTKGKNISLSALARRFCDVLNGEKKSGQRHPDIRGALRKFVTSLGLNDRDDAQASLYIADSVIWNPRTRRYMYARPLIGYGEGEMHSVRDVLGGSIRGYGRGGSIRGYGRGGSIVGKGLIKGVVGAAKKVNGFARRTKFISKGVRALGYGIDSAGYLDSAY